MMNEAVKQYSDSTASNKPCVYDINFVLPLVAIVFNIMYACICHTMTPLAPF